jgi:hypothetical protein
MSRFGSFRSLRSQPPISGLPEIGSEGAAFAAPRNEDGWVTLVETADRSIALQLHDQYAVRGGERDQLNFLTIM